MRKARHSITSHYLNPKFSTEVTGTKPTYIDNVFQIHNLLLATFRLHAVYITSIYAHICYLI